jgi:hypothetical protein
MNGTEPNKFRLRALSIKVRRGRSSTSAGPMFEPTVPMMKRKEVKATTARRTRQRYLSVVSGAGSSARQWRLI